MSRASISSSSKAEGSRQAVSLVALDRYLETNIVSPVEKARTGGEFVEWGDHDAYPRYLFELYQNVPTLRSAIDGTVDFIGGDDCSCIGAMWNNGRAMNRAGETPFDIVRNIAWNLMTYGGFALQVIRSADGFPVEIYSLDLRYLRSNKEGTVFYYSEKFGQPVRSKVMRYPAFQDIPNWASLTDAERDEHASSILYVKGEAAGTYPVPCYAASVKACEIERCIDNFHLNSINNSFTGSVIVNFNNGTPEDAIKEEIERDVREKFSGHQNGGRIVLSWNENRESQTTVTPIKVEDFGARYDALAKHSRQQIFTAFRANPNLFGIPTENLGFSSEEYESAFRLYNRVRVRPAQRTIADAFERLYGAGALTIIPFNLDEQSAGEGAVR